MADVKRTSICIDEALYKKVKIYCIKNDVKSIKIFINDAIEEKLKEK